MRHNLPKLRFHRDQFITLNEGFDRAGRFTFPLEWTGQEAFAWPEAAPELFRNEREELENEFQRLNKRATDLHLMDTFGMDADQQEQVQQAAEDASAQREQARNKLSQFGRAYDSRFIDAEAYARRTEVEGLLCRAMEKRELLLHFGTGTGIRLGDWQADNRYFEMSFGFSYVIAPKSYGGRRRFPAYFKLRDFNAWAEPKEAELTPYEAAPIEERMIEWFLKYRAVCLAEGRKVRQEDVRAECEEHFGRKDLGRKFEAVWKLLAVDEIRKVGRTKKSA
ncbi:hypothetical protein [Leisingera thetidis]|uniref:hypothetical protein n=1 Tax=Leisingera thetidis TaxID=2930199 RepID=UPI0021F7FE10|nr:hypothetical protein [Leisingera thetidis]